MPRKRRPTPPLPGSIVRNLAPKPDAGQGRSDTSGSRTPILPSSSSRQSTAGSDGESSTCGVPQCTLSNCQLPTHLNYARLRRLAVLRSQGQKSPSPYSPSATMTEANSYFTIKQTMDSKVTLPIDDTPNRDYQRLFINFFQFHIDSFLLVFRPQTRDPAFKQNVYRLGLHNPVYCLTLVAQAHMNNIKDNHVVPDAADESLTDIIYTHLLTLTREKVESFDLADTDVLLMAIVVLCEYDLQLHQYDALSAHQNGIRVLVTKRGGIHNLGLSLPFVLRMDRFLAIRSNQMPQFASPELAATSAVTHQLEDGGKYGLSFRARSSLRSEPINSVCSDAAYLLELMDEIGVTFSPSQTSERLDPKMEYFHFLRENIEARFTILNAQHQRSNQNVNHNLLALCATHLVTYYVTQANYLPLVTDLLATRLWNLLTKTPHSQSPTGSKSSTPPFEAADSDPSSIPKINLADWKDNIPLLLWFLFACALPASRVTSMTFTGHLSSSRTSPTSSSAQPASRPSLAPRSQSSRSILSPSSPRRHRYLPTFILYVAEHLVGERPISGTRQWDRQVIRILERYIWPGDRLAVEFNEIVQRVHESVLARAEDD